MRKFWNTPKQAEEIKYPRISFELIDDVNLDVRMSWPKGTDISHFAQLLVWLNQGNLIGPQIAAALVNAKKVGDQESGELLQSVLTETMQSRKKKTEPPPNKPLIAPTQALKHLMKFHNH